MPSRIASVLLPLLAAAVLAQSATAGTSKLASAARLRELQRDLDRVTERIRVGTAVWLSLVRGVRADQAEIRRATAEMRRVPKHSGHASGLLRRTHARMARGRRALASVFPAWLAVKASLHHDYRLVKALLARSRRRPFSAPATGMLMPVPTRTIAPDRSREYRLPGPRDPKDVLGA